MRAAAMRRDGPASQGIPAVPRPADRPRPEAGAGADTRTSREAAIAAMRTYPFTAVSPEVGGVLVRGQKGTAKSTMVRALAALLPAVGVVDGCRFSCDPADA